jgi:hypothetical protein
VLYSGLVAATTLFSGLLIQRPLRRATAGTAGRFGVVAGAVGLSLGAFATAAGSPLGVLAAAVALGCGYGGCLIAGLRFIEVHAEPAHRGRVTGVFYVLAYLGFSAPLVLATLARAVGNTSALLGAAALAAAVLVLRSLDSAGA